MKKLLKKIKWSDVRIVLMLAALLFLYSFSNKRSENRNLKKLEIVFKGEETHFVTSGDIENIVNNNLTNISYVNRTLLDLNKLEQNVLKNRLIKSAEVYLTIDGVLTVEVVQKKAIGRVVNENTSYYLDEDGNKMPLSSNYTERVVLIEGNIKEHNQQNLKQMLEIINNDEFLKKEITGISIQPKETIYLKTRLNQVEILFGQFSQMERKLMNYKVFVQYAMKENIELNSYKKINLKFTQQVVCSK